MASDSLHDKGKALEDIFFAERDRQLIEALKSKAAKDKAAVDLAALTGIQEPAVLTRLADLGISPDTLAAFAMVPLLYVGWADKVLDHAERQAILVEANAAGIREGTAGYELLASWLHRQPDESLIEAWQSYHASLVPHLSEAEHATLAADLMAKARRIARSSGGVLGMGSVNAAEKEALARLEALLS